MSLNMIEWIKNLGVQKVSEPEYGRGHLGFAPKGAMDKVCLENLKQQFSFSDSQSCIWELSLFATSLVAQEKVFVVMLGASRSLHLEELGKTAIKNEVFELEKGHALRLSSTSIGVYSYLLVSRKEILKISGTHCLKQYAQPVRVYNGLEASQERAAEFCKHSWTVSPNSNRMGIRLLVNSLDRKKTNRLFEDTQSYPSNPVWDGVVQWTGSELIILHRERATLGGYPRVLEVCEIDLSRIAQYKPGEVVRFELIAK